MDDDARRALERIAFGPARTGEERREAEAAARELARLEAEAGGAAAAGRATRSGGSRPVRRTRVGASVMHPVPPRPPRPAWRHPALIAAVVVVVLGGLAAAGLSLAASVLQTRGNPFLGAQGFTAQEVRALDIPAFDVFDRPATARELRYLDELEVGGRVVQLGPRILGADDDWDYAAVVIRSLVTTIEPRACVWALGDAGASLACTDLTRFAEAGVEGEAGSGSGTVAFRWSADGAFSAVPAP